jgi:hypothetical protein
MELAFVRAPRTVRQNGVYLYIPQPADRSGIERAIDDAVSEMSMLTRGIARKRLHQSTEPIHRFQVHVEPDLVLLRLYKHDFALPLDGRAVPARGLGAAAWLAYSLRFGVPLGVASLNLSN